MPSILVYKTDMFLAIMSKFLLGMLKGKDLYPLLVITKKPGYKTGLRC